MFGRKRPRPTDGRVYGHAILSGQEFTIVDVAFVRGVIQVTCLGQGPMPELFGGPLTIYGEDGRGLLQTGAEAPRVPALREGDTALVTCQLRVAEVR